MTLCYTPDSKVHGANMGPTWVLSASDGPHVVPMNLAIRVRQTSDLSVWTSIHETKYVCLRKFTQAYVIFVNVVRCRVCNGHNQLKAIAIFEGASLSISCEIESAIEPKEKWHFTVMSYGHNRQKSPTKSLLIQPLVWFNIKAHHRFSVPKDPIAVIYQTQSMLLHGIGQYIILASQE